MPIGFSFNPRRAATLLALVCLSLPCSEVMAGNTFKYRSTDGTMVFSDVRAGSSATRQYKVPANTSRSTAKVSCKGHIEKRLTNPKTNIQASINHFAKKYGINPHLVKAVARIESCFDIYAVSSAGAKGLMQLMPKTAQQYGIFDLFNVNKNIETGVRYLAEMMKRFEYNEKFALAAYNAGPSAVTHYQGIPPYPETQAYVRKVLGQFREYSLSASR